MEIVLKIKTEFVILFSIVLIITVGAISLITTEIIKNSIIKTEIQEMKNKLMEKEFQFHNLHERASEDLVFALKNPLFVEYFELPESKARNEYKDGVLQFTDQQREIKSKLENWIFNFQNKFQVDETCLIDVSGQEHVRLVLKKIAPDSDLSSEEKSVSFFEPSFEKSIDEVHVQYPYISPDTNRWVFAYASPIVLGDTQKPAIFHFEMPMSIFHDLLEINNGRMYVVDPKGYLISDSYHYLERELSIEFEKNFPSVNTILPQTEFDMFKQRIKSEDSGQFQYVDANGDTNYAVFKKLEVFDWILVYQESKNRILSEYQTESGNLFINILIISTIITGISVVGIFFISSKITRPITILRNTMKAVENGVFDSKIKVKGSDEILDLQKSFVHMSSSFKKIIELEKTIALSEQKLKNEKFAAIGAVATRITHDLRTPLSAIKITVGLLKMKYEHADKKSSDHFKILEESIEKITYQVNDVLGFVKTSPIQLKEHSISEIIKSTLIQINVPVGIIIQKPKTDRYLICDDKKLEIVFVNLIINAIHAIGDDDGIIKIHIKTETRKIIIEFENSGPGIPDEQLSKIFEPLFTTKKQGTGLGLVSCKTIIEQHGGKIEAFTNPTKFVITLPTNIS